MLDLQRAYLQVRVHKSLRLYQTVIFEGKRYCLTRIGFGLNMAPSIMWAIVEVTLSKDDAIRQATLAYIFINEDIVSATRVRHLANFGLANKEPEWLQNSVQVLGLTIWGKGNMLIWGTREWGPKYATYSYLRQCVLILWKASQAHFPVVKWLKAAAAFIKRRAADLTKGWDNKGDWCSFNNNDKRSCRESTPRRPRVRKVVC